MGEGGEGANSKKKANSNTMKYSDGVNQFNTNGVKINTHGSNSSNQN